MQSEDFLHENNMQPRSQSKPSKQQLDPPIPQIPQLRLLSIVRSFRGGPRPPSQLKRNPLSTVGGHRGRCPPLNVWLSVLICEICGLRICHSRASLLRRRQSALVVFRSAVSLRLGAERESARAYHRTRLHRDQSGGWIDVERDRSFQPARAVGAKFRPRWFSAWRGRWDGLNNNRRQRLVKRDWSRVDFRAWLGVGYDVSLVRRRSVDK